MGKYVCDVCKKDFTKVTLFTAYEQIKPCVYKEDQQTCKS